MIALYKIFKPVFFHDDNSDVAAWSYEVVNLAKILFKNGHEVCMISESDLKENDDIKIGNINEWYSRIIIIGGTFKEDKYRDGVIKKLSKQCTRLDFILTDLALQPDNKDLYKYFTNIYTMASQPIIQAKDIWGFPIPEIYGGLAELRLYDIKMEEIPEKTIEFYFGGTERKRLDDFLEYIWRPGHVITTKSKFLGIENRSTRTEFLKTLSKTKYSICIADPECNEKHFMSPRPYECFVNDIIAFTDSKFDIDGKIIPKDSWLRVHNYKELREKMNELNENKEKYNEIIAWQHLQITEDKINGDYIYNIIK